MKHRHEPEVQLDNTIKCRTCEETLSYYEEEIVCVDSKSKAYDVLLGIAIAGGYTADAFIDGFVLFGKEQYGIRTTASIQRISKRKFRVYKVIRHY